MKELQHKFYVGQSGSGKTTYAKNDIKKIYKQYQLIVFLNTQHEAFVDAITENVVWSIGQLKTCVEQKKRIVVYKIPLEEEIDDVEEFEILLRYLWYIKRLNEEKNILLIIDEADRYCTKLRIPKLYSDLMTKGRRYNFVIWNITQRPQLVHNVLLTQTKQMIIFELSRYDYDFMLKWFDYSNPSLYGYVILENGQVIEQVAGVGKEEEKVNENGIKRTREKLDNGNREKD